jgi:arsenate reductase
MGKVGTRLHIEFDDPAMADGSEEEVIRIYRRVRDEIREQFTKFYSTKLLDGME